MLLPMESHFSAANFSPFHTHLSCLGVSGTFSSSKANFPFELDIASFTNIMVFWNIRHSHFCGLNVIWCDEHLIGNHLMCFRSQDVFLKWPKLNDMPGIYLKNKHPLVHPSLRSWAWAKNFTCMILVNPHINPKGLEKRRLRFTDVKQLAQYDANGKWQSPEPRISF